MLVAIIVIVIAVLAGVLMIRDGRGGHEYHVTRWGAEFGRGFTPFAARDVEL